MWYDVAPRAAHIVVHTAEPPSDDEWAEYLEHAGRHIRDVRGILACSPTVGPNSHQRRVATEHWDKLGITPTIAVLTRSKVTRGIVTALSWFMGTSVRAHAMSDFDGAARHLGLDDEQRRQVQRLLERLAADAGISRSEFDDAASGAQEP